MPKNEDLHGNAPDKSKVALLLIDVINDFDFEDGDKLLNHTIPVAKNLVRFKRQAKKAKIPVIYVNDNFGKWQSNFKNLLTHCTGKDCKGAAVAKLLAPDDDDILFSSRSIPAFSRQRSKSFSNISNAKL